MAKKLLTKYKEKRDFSKTQEPDGNNRLKKNKQLKFVVQFHRARREHFDFRLEWRGVLLSWAVPKGPSTSSKDKRLAVEVEPHPLDYANFEGVIPKGQYGGGSVMIWDEGTFAPLNDFDKGLKEGVLKFQLFGSRLEGGWTLVKMDKENWLLIKERDEFEGKNTLERFKTSVKSNRTSREIENEALPAKKNPFQMVDVQLATLVTSVPKEKLFFEIKYDGYRMVAFVEQDRAVFKTRNNRDCTTKFKDLAKTLVQFAKEHAMVLDGEVVVTDEKGRPDFQALQQHLKNPTLQPQYIVFDLLAYDGEDLRDRPLIERKALLEKIMKNAPLGLGYSSHIVGSGRAFFREVEKAGLEGIVGKDPQSVYRGGRSEDWIKIKCYKRQEFVIGGFTMSDKKAGQIGALLLGIYKNDKLVFVGRAGTGINEREGAALLRKFARLKRKTSPFSNTPKVQAIWLAPRLVAEVQFAEVTNSGTLRQASYKGLRIDKSAEEVIEFPGGAEAKKDRKAKAQITISNPDRVVFKKPKVTKGEIAEYYQKVAKRMLKFVEGRVLSVVRANETIKTTFYKKHPTCEVVGEKTILIKNDDNEKQPYFYIASEEGILGEVQLGTIEFHTWSSRADSLEKPDMMVFDLDPDKNLSLDKLRQGVKDVRKVLLHLGLKSFLKTSGGKGYHIVVPLEKGVNWNKFYSFAQKVASVLEEKYPDKYTTNIRKANRKGKIFIDYMRNNRGSTSVAPYSLRAREGAKVSMPLAWSELDKVAPDGVDMQEAIKRLSRPDPWRNFYKTKQSIK